jgi:vacuolar protein sorting-associated protein 18
MGMWEESVELALDMGELELAKVNADRPEDDEVLRKKLWLMVAKYVVQDKKDIKTYVYIIRTLGEVGLTLQYSTGR